MVSCCHGGVSKRVLKQQSTGAGNRAAAEVQLGIVRTVVVALQFLVGSERQHSEKQQSPVVNINGNSCHCTVR